MKPYRNPALLLSNRILMMLHGGGPRTNSELAVMLNFERGSVSGANSMNASRGFVSYTRVKGQSEVVYTVTQEGIDHVMAMQTMTLQEKPFRYSQAQLKLIERMKTGFRSRDWQEIFGSRGHMYMTVMKLSKQGLKIKKVKVEREVTYILET